MPQVTFNTNSFHGSVVTRTEISELYWKHRNLCRMAALSPTEKAEALSLVAKEILK
jgi:hypothetical protein